MMLSHFSRYSKKRNRNRKEQQQLKNIIRINNNISSHFDALKWILFAYQQYFLHTTFLFNLLILFKITETKKEMITSKKEIHP